MGESVHTFICPVHFESTFFALVAEQVNEQTMFYLLHYSNGLRFFKPISQQVESFSTDGFCTFSQSPVRYPATLHRKTDARESGGNVISSSGVYLLKTGVAGCPHFSNPHCCRWQPAARPLHGDATALFPKHSSKHREISHRFRNRELWWQLVRHGLCIFPVMSLTVTLGACWGRWQRSSHDDEVKTHCRLPPAVELESFNLLKFH